MSFRAIIFFQAAAPLRHVVADFLECACAPRDGRDRRAAPRPSSCSSCQRGSRAARGGVRLADLRYISGFHFLCPGTRRRVANVSRPTSPVNKTRHWRLACVLILPRVSVCTCAQEIAGTSSVLRAASLASIVKGWWPQRAAPGYAHTSVGDVSHHCARSQIGHKSEPCASACGLLQPACCSRCTAARHAQADRRTLADARTAARGAQAGRNTSADATTSAAGGAAAPQTDRARSRKRLENAIAASTEPDEQKELAEKLGMSRMSAEMSVLSANGCILDAFQSCDVAKMKAVWSDRRRHVRPPGPPADFGRGPRPEQLARALLERRRHAGSRHSGSVRGPARLGSLGHVQRSTRGRAVGARSAGGANVFERRDGRWYMVHHQAGPVFVQQPPQ